MPSFSPKGDKSSSAEKTNGDEKGSFSGTEPGSHPVTILGRQLKPGLLPMVPELAKQTRLDMMNAVVAPIAQVKHEPQVNKPVIRHWFLFFCAKFDGGAKSTPYTFTFQVVCRPSGANLSTV